MVSTATPITPDRIYMAAWPAKPNSAPRNRPAGNRPWAGIGKGRGIETDRSLQAVIASLLNGGRGALGVPLTPGVTRGQQAQRRGHDKHGDQDERGDQRGLLGGSALGSKLAIIDGLGPDDNARRRLLNETVDGGRRHALASRAGKLNICGTNMAGIATDSGKGQYSGAPEALVKSIG